MSHEKNQAELPAAATSTYVAGYVLSLLLTISAYSIVWRHVNTHHVFISDNWLNPLVIVLALVQLVVQLVFFLHLSRESKPRWNLAVLAFAFLIVAILVIGSVWIMFNLNRHYGHQAVPTYSDEHIIHDEGVR